MSFKIIYRHKTPVASAWINRRGAEKQPDPERQAKAALKRDRRCQRNLRIQAAGGYK